MSKRRSLSRGIVSFVVVLVSDLQRTLLSRKLTLKTKSSGATIPLASATSGRLATVSVHIFQWKTKLFTGKL